MIPDRLTIKTGGVRSFRRGSFVSNLLTRLAQAVLAMLGASVLIWALLPLAGGDPATRVLQARGVENPGALEIEATRRELNLDEPRVIQYFTWLGRAVRGDLSISFQSGRPVAEEIAKRFPATALLAVVALIFSIVLSVSAALISAAFYDKSPDNIIRFLTQAGAAMPPFLLGLLVLQFVVVGFGWGKVVSGSSVADAVLPALCLAVGRASDWTQILRANLLEALEARYTLVARARGATRWRVLLRYALPNALLPFLTVVGVGIGSLFGGAVIVETVFSWNGIGSYAVGAIGARDLPVVQGFVVVATLIYVVSSLLVDALAEFIDPRLREAK
jgi:ABC-type dipeptide/oligopeptide/nickel transport system permease component